MSILVAAAALAAAQGPALSAPPMWRVSDDDSRVWLFGSMHALPEGTQWRSALFDEVFEEVDLYYYEALMDAHGQAEVQAAVMRLGLNPPGESLTGYLTEAEADLLRRLAAAYGLPVTNLEVMRPWLAGLTLSVGAMQTEGFSMTAGVELTLQPQTPDWDERYFETPGGQLRIFADLPHDVQVGTLITTLHQLVEMHGVFHTMFEAWHAGDLEALEAVLEALAMEEPSQVREALIVRRNEAWVEDITELMAGAQDALIVVGVGHLVGDDALPGLLEAKGYTVERVQ
jgi:hypothetical protein